MQTLMNLMSGFTIEPGVEASVIGFLSAANRTFVVAEVDRSPLPFVVFELEADSSFSHMGNFAYRSDAFEILTSRTVRVIRG